MSVEAADSMSAVTTLLIHPIIDVCIIKIIIIMGGGGSRQMIIFTNPSIIFSNIMMINLPNR